MAEGEEEQLPLPLRMPLPEHYLTAAGSHSIFSKMLDRGALAEMLDGLCVSYEELKRFLWTVVLPESARASGAAYCDVCREVSWRRTQPGSVGRRDAQMSRCRLAAAAEEEAEDWSGEFVKHCTRLAHVWTVGRCVPLPGEEEEEEDGSPPFVVYPPAGRCVRAALWLDCDVESGAVTCPWRAWPEEEELPQDIPLALLVVTPQSGGRCTAYLKSIDVSAPNAEAVAVTERRGGGITLLINCYTVRGEPFAAPRTTVKGMPLKCDYAVMLTLSNAEPGTLRQLAGIYYQCAEAPGNSRMAECPRSEIAY